MVGLVGSFSLLHRGLHSLRLILCSLVEKKKTFSWDRWIIRSPPAKWVPKREQGTYLRMLLKSHTQKKAMGKKWHYHTEKEICIMQTAPKKKICKNKSSINLHHSESHFRIKNNISNTKLLVKSARKISYVQTTLSSVPTLQDFCMRV